MASEVGYDGLDGDHDGHPALGQKQPTTRPIIKKKRTDNDDGAKEILEIVKANANFRKEKFEQQHAVPRFDEQKCFI
jgi:hypothetical protein